MITTISNSTTLISFLQVDSDLGYNSAVQIISIFLVGPKSIIIIFVETKSFLKSLLLRKEKKRLPLLLYPA